MIQLLKQVRLAVIIPARSEQETVEQVVTTLREALNPMVPSYRVLLIDDQSADDTVSRAVHTGGVDHVLQTASNRSGLAAAFRLGVSTGLDLGADVFVTIDSDAQYDPTDVVRLLEACSQGAELVIGNRLVNRPSHMNRFRYVGNRMYSQFWTSGLVDPRIDCQSGLRAFTRGVASGCRIESSFTYTQEQTIRALREHRRVRSIPVSFFKREHGRSRLVRSPIDFALRTVGPALAAKYGKRQQDECMSALPPAAVDHVFAAAAARGLATPTLDDLTASL